MIQKQTEILADLPEIDFSRLFKRFQECPPGHRLDRGPGVRCRFSAYFDLFRPDQIEQFGGSGVLSGGNAFRFTEMVQRPRFAGDPQ